MYVQIDWKIWLRDRSSLNLINDVKTMIIIRILTNYGYTTDNYSLKS